MLQITVLVSTENKYQGSKDARDREVDACV